MSNNTPSCRAAIMVKRLETLIKDLGDEEFLTLRIVVTDGEGYRLRLGRISELDDLSRGERG